MDTATRNDMIRHLFNDICMEILGRKGKAYAQTDRQPDANANFKRSAEAAGIDVLQAWLVFYNKHHDSIETYIRTGTAPEPITEVIADAINYPAILYTLLVELGRISPSATGGVGGVLYTPLPLPIMPCGGK